MTTKHSELPDGIEEKDADWHFEKFVEFTAEKQRVSEPSPHLSMVGKMSEGLPVIEKVWRIGCYAIPYSLPVGQAMWQRFTAEEAMYYPETVTAWIEKNWQGILKGTRRERRCVRTSRKYNICTMDYINFMKEDFPKLQEIDPETLSNQEYYEKIWKKVQNVKYFGRYIGIRVVEGLRRYCGMPAELPDIRSMGAWSPRKCLVYLYPEQHEILLNESAENNKITEEIAWELSNKVKQVLPKTTHYIVAAMLCEYRDAFEDRRQYPGWTIDQEPLLHKKSKEFFGDRLDSNEFWKTRETIFPRETLGEHNGWEGTRWDITNILRDYGYVWSDIKYEYRKTDDFANPSRR